MVSAAELPNAVFLSALVIVLLDSTMIVGIQLQCIAASDTEVIPEEGSTLFALAGGNHQSLRRCECGEDVRKTLEIIEARLISLGDPARKLEALKFRVEKLETSWNDVEVLKNTVDKVETSWNDVEVLKNDVSSIQKDIQMLKQGLNEAPSKREVAMERSETNRTVASIGARIHGLDRAGQRVIGILRAWKSFSDNFTIDQKDVVEAKEVSPSVPQRMDDQIEDESTKCIIDSAGVPREEIRENISQTNATAEYVAGSVAESGASTAHNTSKVLSVSEESQHLFREDVKGIEFVGAEGGFSLMPRGEQVAACTKSESTNGTLSPALPAACSIFPNRTEHASVGSSDSVTLTTQDSPDRKWPLERAMILLAAQFMDLQKNIAASRWDDKVAGLEQHAAEANASLSNLGHLVSACEANVTRAFNAMETAVSNITELVEETLQTFGAQIFTKVKNHTANLQNIVDVFRDNIESIWGKLEGTEIDLASFAEDFTVFRREQKDNVGSIESWLLTLNDSVASGATEIRNKLSKFEGINRLLDTRISELDRRFQEAASLIVRLNETLTHLNIDVRKLTQDYNSSIANRDLSVLEKISELERAFTGVIERVNQMVQNMTNVTDQLPLFYGYGWHPDDSTGCPGLKVLATDEHVVLSTELGRFRAPNLPTDLLPTDSVVRFGCSPAGSHRLVGSEELRCLGGGRWSHRPPVCQPLPTLEQLLIADKDSVIVPSIHYQSGEEEYEWKSTDDDGNLVLRPGSKMRLTCLYPRSRGDVVWLHNGTGVAEDAILSWASEAELRGFAYRLWIDALSPKHSGEYSCHAPDGKRHSVKIKVADNFLPPEGACRRPAIPPVMRSCQTRSGTTAAPK